MIALVRIDNRLLHGQILEAWLPRLKARRVVVADDEAASSPLARQAMTLCIPPELDADVVPLAAVDWGALADAREGVLVLVRDVGAVARAAEAGLTPDRARKVNVGNVHFAPGRKPVTPSVFLDEGEVRTLEALAARGFDVELRAIPSDPALAVAQIAERHRSAR